MQKLNKRGQLGWIEMKFFMSGLLIGVIVGLVLAFLSCSTTVLPKVGFICGG